MFNVWSKVTIVVGIGMGLLPLFHVWEMHSVQSSVGQSFWGAVFLEFGIVTWFIYGLQKEILLSSLPTAEASWRA